MKRCLIAGAVAAMAAVGPAMAETPRFRQYHRVFAIERDKIASAMADYPDSFRDGIIVATFVGLQIGKPEVRKSGNHRDFGESVRKKKLRKSEGKMI